MLYVIQNNKSLVRDDFKYNTIQVEYIEHNLISIPIHILDDICEEKTDKT